MTKTGSRRKANFAIGCGLLLVLLLVGGGATAFYARSALQPPAATHGTPVAISIGGGETLDEVVTDLAGKGVVKSQFWFGLYARYQGLAGKLHAGSFLVDSGMGPSEVVAVLSGQPNVAGIKITLAEGLTAHQMADVIAKSGLHITAEQYLRSEQHGTFHNAFLKDVPAGAGLEGFLFPDTYTFAADATADRVVQAQLDDFESRALPLLTSTKLTAYQAVVVASIIEREAKFPDDAPLVSSVIANRLSQGMNLQIDATVLYGVGVIGRSPTAAELQQDTPYNSYLHSGLPPTPIANPGLVSIQAAVQPAASAFLFYVSDCGGHNHYSVTGTEHQQQVTEFLNAPCPAN